MKTQQGLSERYQRRALDVTLACKLTHFSIYADALLWYQQEKIDYATFCMEFQELSWMDGKRTPLNGRKQRMYIMSMREVLEDF